MFNVMRISLKKNIKDVFVLFWSVFLPLAVIFGFKYFNLSTNNSTLFGILTFSIFSQCCITLSFSILSQRKRGVFELLKITPFSIDKYLISIVFVQALISSCIALALLSIENSLFSIGISFLQGILFIPYFVLGSIMFSLLGFILSSFPKDEAHLSIFTNLAMIILLLPSSLFWSLENAPILIRIMSWINPFEWLQLAYKAISQNDTQLAVISLVILAICTLVFFVIARKTFK